MAKTMTYEVLNAAREVVYTGNSAEVLDWCKNHPVEATLIREQGNDKMSLPAGFWVVLAEKIVDHIKVHEDKKSKKEEKRKWRKKEKSLSKSVRAK